MAYEQPTVEKFKARYPTFVGVDACLVEIFLSEAIDHVGALWAERDRAKAQMLYCAHVMAAQGFSNAVVVMSGGRVVADESSTLSPGRVRRHKVGDVEVEFMEDNQAIANNGMSEGGGNGALDLSQTVYGQMFLRLQRLNFPAVAVV